MVDKLVIEKSILEEKLLFKMKQATYYKKKYLEDHRKLKEVREYIEKEYIYIQHETYNKLIEILDKGE